MPKLSIDNQGRVKAYLQNLHNFYGVSIICSVCAYCHEWITVKDGEGNYGISHGLCKKCLPKVLAETKLVG
jgi:hypothetical protein